MKGIYSAITEFSKILALFFSPRHLKRMSFTIGGHLQQLVTIINMRRPNQVGALRDYMYMKVIKRKVEGQFSILQAPKIIATARQPWTKHGKPQKAWSDMKICMSAGRVNSAMANVDLKQKSQQ